jgi:acyl carrier protein
MTRAMKPADHRALKPLRGIQTMIRDRIVGHLGELDGIDTSRLSDDTYLYDAGLTSFGSMSLMLALEESFEIEFPDRMLNRRTFSSIAELTAAVTELVAEKAG